jgi:hypothetical protein
MARKVCVLVGLVFLNLSIVVMLAQSTAQISGAIKDQTGAVLPGVEVSMTQTDTGFKRSAVTDETGSYILPNLPVGPYRLEAALPGFRTYVQTGIVLQIDSNPVINGVLQIGQVSDEVNVQADAALVETRSTGVGQVMDNVRVVELPLNGRRVTDLILISGAAVQGTNTFTYGARGYNQVAISVAGGQGAGVEYTLDGGTHNDVYTGLGVTMPFPDALQEFKLETNALPAQYGHHSSAAVNAVTKSGTNEFHGSLFEFVRNNSFNANNAATQTRDTLKRNQFGGTIGGPVIKNKLFFFGGHQSTLERSSNSPAPEFVPTPAMLEGDFTTFASKACNNGVQRVLRAPVQSFGTDAGGNTIYRVDKSLLSPAALNLAKRLPAAQDACGQIRFNRSVANNEYTTVSRVDYQISEKHSLFGRYLNSYTHNLNDYDGVNVLTFSNSELQSKVHSFVLGDTYTLRPNLVSSFHGTINPITNEAYPAKYFDLSDLGVKNVYQYVPGFFLMTVTNGFNISGGNGIRSTYNSITYQFGEDLSWIRGAHQIGFGGTFIRTQENTKLGLNRNPRPMFNGGITGTGLTDLLLGKMSSMLQAAPGIVYKRQKYFSFYLQDTWKMNSRLTLNAGLRWEPYIPPSHLLGYTTFFDKTAFDRGIHSVTYPTAPAGLQFPGDPGVPGFKFGNNNWNQWAPRLGLAWDPKGDGRMTVRAAYGIFYELPYAQKSGPVLVNAPYAGGLQLTTPPGGFDDPWLGTPGGNPFPISLSNPLFPLRGTYPVYPKTVKNPYVNQWNLSIQRQIGSNWLVSGNYLGTSTIHLWASSDIDPVILTPDATRSNYDARRLFYLQNHDQGQYYGVVAQLDDGATSNFHGLLLSVQHRRTNGLTIQGNYTWSHCIGDLEEAQLGIPSQYEYPGMRNYYRGNCNQDHRHNLNMSTVYETPRLGNSAMRALTGGWRVSGILRILSGSYMTITSGIDTSLTNALGGDRASQVLGNPYPATKTIDQWMNRAAFVQPADGQFGNMAVNNIIGPGSIRIDMGLSRTFRVREKQSVELRAEAFNVPNHVNPMNPTTVLNSPLFGKITTVMDPRILQFALKYAF